MNAAHKWIEKSLKLANEEDYLDRLQLIYPVIPSSKRPLSSADKEQLRGLLKSTEDMELVLFLLKLPRFPIKDPYVAFIRRDPERFLKNNPRTLKRIAEAIRKLSFRDILKEVEQPPELNRQIGSLFRDWLMNRANLSKEDSEDKFTIQSYDSPTLYRTTEQKVAHFCRHVLSMAIEKRPDFVIKVKERYLVGEAKFLTDYGGHQDRQFEDVERFLHSSNDPRNVIRVGVVDGVLWIARENTIMHNKLMQMKKEGKIVLSAIFLEELARSLAHIP